jgi:hypothetical protein
MSEFVHRSTRLSKGIRLRPTTATISRPCSSLLANSRALVRHPILPRCGQRRPVVVRYVAGDDRSWKDRVHAETVLRQRRAHGDGIRWSVGSLLLFLAVNRNFKRKVSHEVCT